MGDESRSENGFDEIHPFGSPSVDNTRIHMLNKKNRVRGEYILYWMQQSQRAEENHALEYAVSQGNSVGLPVVVAFGLTDAYPEANLRHYTFMMEGLRETSASLHARGIRFVLQTGAPHKVALRVGRRAALIVCDRGYLRHQRDWRNRVARQANCRVVQVESDVIVPVETVSPKAEYAARTIRPKIHKLLKDYMVPLKDQTVNHSSLDIRIEGLDPEEIDDLFKRLKIDNTVRPVSDFFRGGTSEAKKRFKVFLSQKLNRYDDHSNQPQTDNVSGMSPYLHFGQISPLTLALQVKSVGERKVGKRNIEAFLEELIIRRELSINFVYFTPDYDAYSCIPDWAAKTLGKHADDHRDHIYSREELETAQTHDPYWNAAMSEMVHTGFMHNYMRMYWGKKILEWTGSPREAFQTAIDLNNRYFLDGRDPNSYTGVAWLFGVHDRAWAERPIFGKVRYMAASGLERKCDIHAYVKKVEKLVGQSAA